MLSWFLTRVVAIAYPIVEILLIVWVGNTVGWGWTLLALGLGVLVGLVLMRAAGRDAFRAVATPMQRHQPYVEIDEVTGVAQTVHPNSQPTAAEVEQATVELRQSGLLFVSGVLFALPGFISDAVAAVLLIPAVRRSFATRLPQRRPTPGVVIVGDTIVTDLPGDTDGADPAPNPYDAGQPQSGSAAVIKGEILPPQRPIE